jgi:cadmium resistance protein CadD (predicted permease)
MGQPSDLLAAIALSVAGFLSTSLDNALLLIGFYAQREVHRRAAALGYLAAATIVVVAAYALGNVVDLAPARYVGYLGFIPMALGLYYLARLGLTQEGDGKGDGAAGAGALTVMLVMLANSADSLAVYITIFADTRDGFESVVLVTALACAVLLCGLAGRLMGWPRAAAVLRRFGRYLLPLLLILIGTYVLMDTRTDLL